MVDRFHRVLRAAIVGAFVFTGFSADAARVRSPHHEPSPIFSPVVAKQLKDAVRRGEAAARKVFGVDKRAGKAAARKGQGRKQDLKPVRLPESGPIPTDNPAKTTVAEATTKPVPSKAAARPPQKLTAKQIKAAARRGQAAARNVVVWAGRAGKAIVRTAKTERTEAAAAQKRRARPPELQSRPRGPKAPRRNLRKMICPGRPPPNRRQNSRSSRPERRRKGARPRQGRSSPGPHAPARRSERQPLPPTPGQPSGKRPTERKPQRRSPARRPPSRRSYRMKVLCRCLRGSRLPRARLRTANVKFVEEAPLRDPLGCSVPYPIRLQNLGPDFEIKPDAVLNCSMAEAVVNFTRGVIAPAAVAEFETRITGLRQASGYVCRPRHGTQRLSEHAFGNALDISSFMLEDGSEITVEATREPQRSVFLSKIRSAACGPFKTVLGPGSDADHALHFHFDLAQRRRGGTFCQ